MRSLSDRLRKIEELLSTQTGGEFNLEQALNFRWAGIPRCVCQARAILTLDRYARRPGCTEEEVDQCRKSIEAIVSAFSYETSLDHANDPNFREDDHRPMLDAAWKVIHDLEADIDRTCEAVIGTATFPRRRDDNS